MGKDTKFKKGNIPWNKGKLSHVKRCQTCGSFIGNKRQCKNINKKGIHINPTSFKKNHENFFEGWGGSRPKSVGKKISVALSGRKNPEHSKRMKKLWQKQEYAEKQCSTRNIKPNKSEQKLDNLLQILFPNEYKYVGDFSLVLGGKCPDFMNINGQKKLIELYGNYFHNPRMFPERQSPKERQAHFNKYGFKTLIIWEKELKNEDNLIKKLEIFQGE